MLAIKTNGLTLYSDAIHHILKIKQQMQGPKFSSQFKLKGPAVLFATKYAPPETFFTNSS